MPLPSDRPWSRLPPSPNRIAGSPWTTTSYPPPPQRQELLDSIESSADIFQHDQGNYDETPNSVSFLLQSKPRDFTRRDSAVYHCESIAAACVLLALGMWLGTVLGAVYVGIASGFLKGRAWIPEVFLPVLIGTVILYPPALAAVFVVAAWPLSVSLFATSALVAFAGGALGCRVLPHQPFTPPEVLLASFIGGAICNCVSAAGFGIWFYVRRHAEKVALGLRKVGGCCGRGS